MWTPDPNEIKPSETIGRRVLGKGFAGPGAKVPEGFFKITVFMDSRLNEDLSFDRLGERGVDKSVTKFLTPLGVDQGQTLAPPQEFSGWAAIPMAKLNFVTLRPTPTDEPHNPFHADLSREDFRGRSQAETLAFRLAILAGKAIVAPAKSVC
jgi:hypothetical protein